MARGRSRCGPSGRSTRTASSKPRGTTAPFPASTWVRIASIALAQRRVERVERRRRRPRRARSRSSASAARFRFRTPPSTSRTSTGSGRLSMAAWEACWAWMRSPSELFRYSSSRSAMVLNSAGQRGDLVLAPGARPRLQVPLAEAAHRQRRAPRAASRSARSRPNEATSPRTSAADGRDHHELEQPLGGAARLVALAHHGVLVEDSTSSMAARTASESRWRGPR